ncbi:MAG: DUF4097 family beta strand repeat-containing protein [Pseudomonadota bacterium]
MRALAGVYLLFAASTVLAEDLDVRANPERDQLRITVSTATIELEPGDDNFVRINYDCVAPEPEPGPDGLRVVKRAGIDPNLSRSSDKIEIRFREEGGDCRLRIKAPPTLATRLRIDQAGWIRIRDWRAPLSAWSAAGDVEVVNQQGPFSITAMSGDASIEYTGKVLETDSAITAASGTIALALPKQPSVSIRARAKWGDVMTDLDVVFADQVNATGAWSVTELGDGGPMITLRNLNEDIRILSSF